MTSSTGIAGANRVNAALLFVTLGVLVWSGIGPHDRLTWVLEVVPVVVAIVLLTSTYRRFRFAQLAYAAVFVHCVILCIGGHWTYSEVPIGNWLRDAWGLSRNHYDRLGHFAQGFVPAILTREMYLRKTPLKSKGWLFFTVSGVCLGFSAAFEFIEWWVAVAAGGDADAYLATQGDQWDTQWDMFLALCGAMIAQLSLGRLHDRQLKARGFI